MRTTTRRYLLLSVTALALLASACSGGSDAETVEAAGSTSGSSSTGTSSQASTSATGDAASPTPTLPGWVSDSLDGQDDIRYIANTGGVGVSHRSACETAARIDGSWPEGTELEIVLDSEPGCENWALLSDGQITSWVSTSYLSLTEPVRTTAPVAATSTGTGTGSSRQIEVINFFGNLIPTTYLKVRPATYTYNNTVLISGCAQSWHPVGDSAITTTGKIIANPDPQNCGFGAVELVPAYWITTSS